MTDNRIYLFDTTLRDGQQTRGVDFTPADKIAIARALDEIGIDYVEGGWPGANPTDDRFFAEPPKLERATLVAFGMTRRPGRSADNDPGLAGVLGSKAGAACLVGKTWDFHVDVALEIERDENVQMIRDSMELAIKRGFEPMFDCEHFFDGYKANPDYALACVRAAHEAGARWVVLCDTNGGTQPAEIRGIVESVIAAGIPGDRLGIHAHDDTGQAVANSLAAIEAGVRQVQGTLNGIGERCGNANLTSLIPTLMLKPVYADAYEIGVSDESLAGLTKLAHRFDELVNRSPNRQAAYVGASAFATKAGIHASAIVKDPKTYEHVDPARVGNRRHVLVSDQAGKANLVSELERMGIAVGRDDPRLESLLREVKHRESVGYAYEAAGASFELLARRKLGSVPDYFDVEGFHVTVERRHNAIGELVTVSEAVVKLIVGGERLLTVAEGNGPVNALDTALRKDLGVYRDVIADLELIDFKVRILNGGTGAVTRVLIESADGTGDSWFTVGVSENIVDASFEALHDSLIYKLLRSGAKAVS